jgi:peptidoglycan LD-endopeptidase LytH
VAPDKRNLLAAAVAGVLIGAVTTAVLMSKAASRTPPAAALEGSRAAPGVNPDDVVAVLDAETAATPRSKPAVGTAGNAAAPVDPSVPSLSAGVGTLVDELRRRRLTVPVQGFDAAKLVASFDDQRGGSRRHEAIDILAPRNTPVVAVENGRIARLFMSKAGGITLYQYDPSERFVYYYAHLERYADGLIEGAPLARGQVIGYVGTSGNAPPGTPHLHFAIVEMTERRKWWEGRAIDPFLVLR